MLQVKRQIETEDEDNLEEKPNKKLNEPNANYGIGDELIHLEIMTAERVSDDYVKWMNDLEITRYLETRFSKQSKNDIEQFVRSKLSDPAEYLFAVIDNATGKHIGNCKIGPIDWNHRQTWISLLIGNKSFWGKSYGKHIVKCAKKIALEQLGLRKLVAGSYGSNKASIQAFLHNGFTIEGKQKDYFLLDGIPEDCILLGFNE